VLGAVERELLPEDWVGGYWAESLPLSSGLTSVWSTQVSFLYPVVGCKPRLLPCEWLRSPELGLKGNTPLWNTTSRFSKNSCVFKSYNFQAFLLKG